MQSALKMPQTAYRVRDLSVKMAFHCLSDGKRTYHEVTNPLWCPKDSGEGTTREGRVYLGAKMEKVWWVWKPARGEVGTAGPIRATGSESQPVFSLKAAGTIRGF